MSGKIIATANSGTHYEPVPAGSYYARCYSMIHIGTLKENIMGTEKTLNKVRVTWELPTETKVFKEERGEEPYSVSKEFTLSMHEKATLRKFLESWRGKGFTEDEAKSFDITNLLGKPCMISIIHRESKSGNTYAEITGVSAVPKGFEAPPQINNSFIFSYDPFEYEKFDKLPDFIKDKIRQTPEYEAATHPSSVVTTEVQDDNDLPF